MSRLLGLQHLTNPEMVLPEDITFTPALFEAFCIANPSIECELDTKGNIVFMPPANAEADGKNAELLADFVIWSRISGATKVFGPSAGFTLSNHAVRSPDITVLDLAAWNDLATEQQQSFPLVTPLFVLELRSSDNDSLPALQDKMVEYLGCGIALAWLIDPQKGMLHAYRQGQDPILMEKPDRLSDIPELPGLDLDLSRIW